MDTGFNCLQKMLCFAPKTISYAMDGKGSYIDIAPSNGSLLGDYLKVTFNDDGFIDDIYLVHDKKEQ